MKNQAKLPNHVKEGGRKKRWERGFQGYGWESKAGEGEDGKFHKNRILPTKEQLGAGRGLKGTRRGGVQTEQLWGGGGEPVFTIRVIGKERLEQWGRGNHIDLKGGGS